MKKFLFLLAFFLSSIHAFAQVGVWERIPTNTTDISDVHFFSKTDGLLCGKYYIKKVSLDPSGKLTTSEVSIKSDITPSSLGTNNEFFKFCFINETIGFISGYGTNSFILKTTDGGKNWYEDINCNQIKGAKFISFSDANNGLALKNNEIYYTANGGLSWNLKSTITATSITNSNPSGKPNLSTGRTLEFCKLVYINKNGGGRNAFLTGTPGLLLISTNDGLSWTQAITDLPDVDCGNPLALCTLLGTNCYWLFDNPENSVIDISFCKQNRNLGLATTFQGFVLKTSDGGVHWSKIQTSANINQFTFHYPLTKHGSIDELFVHASTSMKCSWQDENNCWIFYNLDYWGGTVNSMFHSSDAGNTWRERTINGDKNPENITNYNYFDIDNSWVGYNVRMPIGQGQSSRDGYLQKYSKTEDLSINLLNIDKITKTSFRTNYNLSITNLDPELDIQEHGLIYYEKREYNDIFNISECLSHSDFNILNLGNGEQNYTYYKYNTEHGPIGNQYQTVNMFDGSSLKCGTKYVVRAFARLTKSQNVIYSNILEVETLGCNSNFPEVVTKCPITNIKKDIASGGGSVTNPSSSSATIKTMGLCWGTNESVDLTNCSNNKTVLNGRVGNFTSDVGLLSYFSLSGSSGGNLKPNTKYYVKAYATNSDKETGYGENCSFVTLPKVATVLTGTPTATTAPTLGGKLQYTSPQGSEPLITEGIIISKITGETYIGKSRTVVEKTPSGVTDYTVANIDGLTPCTTYYVRAFVKNETGVAYGEELSFNTEHDYGWSAIAPEATTGILGYDYFSTDLCWGVGANGKVIKSTDGGYHWIDQASGISDNIQSVDFYDGSNGWAVVSTGNKIIKTINGGSYWSIITIPTTILPATNTNTKIQFYTATDGFIASNDRLLKTTDGGSNWSIALSKNINDFSIVLKSPSYYVWAACADGVFKSTDAGSTWSTTPQTSFNFRSIFMMNDQIGWGSCFTINPTTLIKTINGNTWTSVIPPYTDIATFSFYFTDQNTGWMALQYNHIGDPNIISRTTDAGNTWLQEYSIDHCNGQKNINNLKMIDNNVGYALSTTQGILKRNNIFKPSVKTSTCVDKPSQGIYCTTNPLAPYFYGTITSDGCASGGITSRGFYYWYASFPNNKYSTSISGSNPSYSGQIPYNCSGELMYVQAYAVNSCGEALGNIVSYSSHCIPVIITKPDLTHTQQGKQASAMCLKANSAIICDTIESNGNLPITELGAIYSLSPNVTATNYLKKVVGYGEDNFNVFLDSLSPFTTYYIKTYAVNDSGVGYSPEFSFTTLHQAVLPTLAATTITLPASSADSLTYVFANSNLTNDGYGLISARGFIYTVATNSNFSDTSKNRYTYNGDTLGAYIGCLSNLDWNTNYICKSFATNEIGTSYGPVISFTTLHKVIAPTCNLSASGASDIAANISINITNTGYSSNNMSIGCIYDTTAGVSMSQNLGGAYFGKLAYPNTLASTLDKLLPNTLFHIKGWAENEGGIGFSSESTFTSMASVHTDSILAFSTTSASILATVPNLGKQVVNARGIIYGTTQNVSDINKIASIPNGSGFGSFTTNIANLNPNTTYYVKAYATNPGGTSYGNELSFTTLQGYTISGTVRYPAYNPVINQNNFVIISTKPMPRVPWLRLMQNGVKIDSVLADSLTGTFVFDTIPNGTYKIEINDMMPVPNPPKPYQLNIQDVTFIRQYNAGVYYFDSLQIKATNVNMDYNSNGSPYINIQDVDLVRQKNGGVNPATWIIPNFVYAIETSPTILPNISPIFKLDMTVIVNNANVQDILIRGLGAADVNGQ